MPRPGQLIILTDNKGRSRIHKIEEGRDLHTQFGVIKAETLAAAEYGEEVRSHLGASWRIIRPTIYDLVKGVSRSTQIVYPKEIGCIIMKLGIGPGVRVIEAGSGSGGLTTALAWFVGDSGRVETFERRPEFHELCQKNLDRVGLKERVHFYRHDIAEGFLPPLESPADCLFLDVRTPWEYLDKVVEAVIPGAPTGFLLPTTNQVSELLKAFESAPFCDIEVLEIFLRRYKPVAERLRPEDRMVAHTGFLIFARVGALSIL